MLQFNQPNQSIGIPVTAVPVAYAVLNVQGVLTNPGLGVINAQIAGKFYELIPTAADLNSNGVISFVLLDAGGNVVGSHIDVVVAAFPAPLTAVADAILDNANGVETGITLRQAMRAIGAVLAGVSSVGVGTAFFKGLASGTTRVTTSVPGDGSRPAVTLNL